MADEGSPEDTMRGRGIDSRLRLWLLLGANRWVIVAALAVVLFATLVVLGTLDATPLRSTMRGSDPTETVFQALITSIITGVTLVVTINQLVLSAELGPLGDQRARMSNSMEFRADTEDMFGEVSPTEPAAFLQALVETSADRAADLRDSVAGADDRALRDDVEEYTEGLIDHARTVSDQLEDAEFGSYDVIQAALNYNYSWKIYRARQLRDDYGDGHSAERREAFDELVRVLTFFGPAREHIKTLYFRWELVDLSRAMIYTSLPALGAAIAALLFLDAPSFPGATLGLDNVLLIVCLGVTASVLPFLVLISYILRIATIAKRTLSVGPFILRESERSGGD
ncbi:hypothetical protein G9464_05455 [Halostella sp. JP-L12]|uniref:hypothetical protein n=1 Tax=Halostella TaxID=1843185 RepID=UPI000EF7A732|nr:MULTISPECIES: hypothetical protein [Halostella]NHN47043.1 hypothetical protein [Halostella sp. JP-L12]